MSKLIFTDPDKARKCIMWLMTNVGSVKPHAGGPLIRGAGWRSWVENYDKLVTHVELDNNVDEETHILFMLKWA
jgi:hypothetical protein